MESANADMKKLEMRKGRLFHSDEYIADALKRFYASGLKRRQFALQEGIPESTLRFWQRNNGRKPWTNNLPMFPEVEQKLFDWTVAEREKGTVLLNSTLAEKAKEIAEQLGIVPFRASDGWITKFKFRHGLGFRCSSVADSVTGNTQQASQNDGAYIASARNPSKNIASRRVSNRPRAGRVRPEETDSVPRITKKRRKGNSSSPGQDNLSDFSLGLVVAPPVRESSVESVSPIDLRSHAQPSVGATDAQSTERAEAPKPRRKQITPKKFKPDTRPVDSESSLSRPDDSLPLTSSLPEIPPV